MKPPLSHNKSEKAYPRFFVGNDFIFSDALYVRIDGEDKEWYSVRKDGTIGTIAGKPEDFGIQDCEDKVAKGVWREIPFCEAMLMS